MADASIVQLGTLRAIGAEQYLQAEAYVLALLRELWPDRDFGPGKTLYWSVVVPLAQGMAATEGNAKLITDGLYLESIRTGGTEVPEDLANRLLSNYYVKTTTGTVSTGTVSVVVSRNTALSLPQGTVFATSQNTYVSTSPIYAYPSQSQVGSTRDRYLQPLGDGTYSFTVPVESAATGLATFAPLGTTLTMQSPPQAFVRAVAATDITGGADAVSAVSSLAEVPAKFAASTFGSRTHLQALFDERYPGCKLSAVGFGDPEMSRDTHNLMGVQTGGMVDLWLATQSTLATESVSVTARLVDPVTRVWEFVLSGENGDGVYAVEAVYPSAAPANRLDPSSVVRSVALDAGRYDPLIETPVEAAFSSYQSLLVQFVDPVTPIGGLVAGATRSATAQLLRMPLIRDAQTFITAPDMSVGTNKVLVRGAVPCVTDITLQVRLLDADQADTIDVTAMRSAIVQRVTQIGFGFGVLSSSTITEAVHQYLTGRSDVMTTSVLLSGTLYAPTGEIMRLSGPEIRVPNEPAKQVSRRTTIFLTDTSRIDIQFLRVEA